MPSDWQCPVSLCCLSYDHSSLHLAQILTLDIPLWLKVKRATLGHLRKVCACQMQHCVKTTSHGCEIKECCLNREVELLCAWMAIWKLRPRRSDPLLLYSCTQTQAHASRRGIQAGFTSKWGATPQQTCVPLVWMVPPKAYTKGHLVCVCVCEWGLAGGWTP